MQNERTKVIGYIRVSTSMQAEEGVSLQAQTARLQAYAVAMNLELVRIETDDISAKNMDRPGLQAGLQALDAGEASGLLIFKLDRLTRSVRDLSTLLEDYFHRFALLSVCDAIDTRTATGRMILNVLTSVAQWEREACSERTKAALSHLKSQGKTLGQKPLTALVPDSVQKIQQLYATGLYSKRRLCKEANRLQIPTARGNNAKWHPTSIDAALSSIK